MDTVDRSTLEGKLLPELQQIAQTMGIEGSQRLRKAGLIDAIVEASSNGERPGNGETRTSSSRERAVATEAVEIGAVTAAADDTSAVAAGAGATEVAPPKRAMDEDGDQRSPSGTASEAPSPSSSGCRVWSRPKPTPPSPTRTSRQSRSRTRPPGPPRPRSPPPARGGPRGGVAGRPPWAAWS